MFPPASSPLVVACSLTADEMPARRRESAAIGEAGLVDAQVSDTTAVLRFASMAGLRDRLEAIVAAESRCCGFMTFELCDEGAHHVLRIAAPADARPVLEQFVALFVPEEAAA